MPSGQARWREGACARRLAVALLALVGTGCPKQPTISEPDTQVVEAPVEERVDAPAICAAGCLELAACVPELASEFDSDPAQTAARLAGECDSACTDFQDQRSGLALRDCLDLDSCAAYWGCIGAPSVQPWLATVAPAGERNCVNLCAQASSCAIAKVCEIEAPPPTEPADEADSRIVVDTDCMRDEMRRGELEEQCVLQCETTPEQGRARTELIGCIDHASCDGMLSCLDSWSHTDYGETREGPVPGVSPTCDAFCTRAIVCGAEQEEVELEPDELDELKQRMTSTYVECAVQCATELEVGADTANAAFEACTASEDCETFTTCANEV